MGNNAERIKMTEQVVADRFEQIMIELIMTVIPSLKQIAMSGNNPLEMVLDKYTGMSLTEEETATIKLGMVIGAATVLTMMVPPRDKRRFVV
jgi:hypothetical protein